MRKKISSFTLIELIMVIVVWSILAGIAIPIIVNSINAWFFLRHERDVISGTRTVINRIAREIRQVRSVAQITRFTSTEFEFVRTGSTNIVFRQSGTSLLRNTSEMTDKLQNPGGLTFTYLDQNGNFTAVQNDIRLVRIRLVLVSGGAQPFTIESSARIRNIYYDDTYI